MLKRIALTSALLAAMGSAEAVRITPAHSGSWYDPAFDKQGFAIEVLGKAHDTGPERVIVVYWYTYDDEGNPIWALGVGETDGDSAELLMQTAYGGARPPLDQPADSLQDFAHMELRVDTCNRATAEFTMISADEAPADGETSAKDESAEGETGQYDLIRLTQIGATTCTGGMADELGAGEEGENIVVHFDGDDGIRLKVKFELEPGDAEFEIDLKKAPAGEYELLLDGESLGTFEVSVTGNNGVTKGSMEFEGGELDFDPRGATIEILNADGEIVVSGVIPLEGTEDDDDEGDGSSDD